jgi:hypothetical protein
LCHYWINTAKVLMMLTTDCGLKYIQLIVAELRQCPPSHQASVGYQVNPEEEWTGSHWHTAYFRQMAASPATVEAATVGDLALLHLHIYQAGILPGSQRLL